MIIYFAGTSLSEDREKFLNNCARLFSYYYVKEDGMANKDWRVRIENSDK